MSILNPTIYQCNFCGAEDRLPERWFKVISLPAICYGNQKRWSEIEIEDAVNTHACPQCANIIHMVLERIAIKHEYDVPATTEPWVWGRIFIP